MKKELLTEINNILDKSFQSELCKGTCETYKKRCRAFIAWVEINYKCQTLTEARKYTDQWLKSRRGLSKKTRLVDASALAKLYHSNSYQDFYLFEEEKKLEYLRMLDLFCRATGLKKKELILLKKDCLVIICDQCFICLGGSENLRMIPVIENSQEIIKYIISCKTEYLWPFVPELFNYETNRRHYALALYHCLVREINEIPLGERYVFESKRYFYDRRALLRLSQILSICDFEDLIKNYLC